jgi:uncharacterized protein (DUF1778 family)
MQAKNLKESTLQLRLSKQQKETMTQASKLQNMSLSHFVLENAYTAAKEILAMQTHFVLSAQQWDEFCELLNAPPRKIPALRRLLNEKSVLDRDDS